MTRQILHSVSARSIVSARGNVEYCTDLWGCMIVLHIIIIKSRWSFPLPITSPRLWLCVAVIPVRTGMFPIAMSVTANVTMEWGITIGMFFVSFVWCLLNCGLPLRRSFRIAIMLQTIYVDHKRFWSWIFLNLVSHLPQLGHYTERTKVWSFEFVFEVGWVETQDKVALFELSGFGSYIIITFLAFCSCTQLLPSPFIIILKSTPHPINIFYMTVIPLVVGWWKHEINWHIRLPPQHQKVRWTASTFIDRRPTCT